MPSMKWGTLEPVLIDDDVYSYLVWAKGRFYEKLVVVVNFGKKSTKNYVKQLEINSWSPAVVRLC